MKQMPDDLPGLIKEEIADSPTPDIPDDDEKPKKKNKFAKNSSMLKPMDKSYLAQFYIKPSYSVVDPSQSTIVAPTPMDIGQADYVDNPQVRKDAVSPSLRSNIGYNMNFEPYASKYDNKLVVDHENQEVIGVMKRHRDSQKTEPEHINVDAASNIDLKFEFAGPKRTSDERHYFKAIKENYVEKLQN